MVLLVPIEGIEDGDEMCEGFFCSYDDGHGVSRVVSLSTMTTGYRRRGQL